MFEFIDGFYGRGDSEQIKFLSRQKDVSWIEHNSQMEYHMQDTTRVINAVEAWRTVIIDENEQIVEDQFHQHDYIDGTGVAAVIIDTGYDVAFINPIREMDPSLSIYDLKHKRLNCRQ